MVTISADVTTQMLKWADKQVSVGLYKSRSEVIRTLFRERMGEINYSLASQKVLEETWKDEDDSYWESVLKKSNVNKK
jgi:Arc/MetJ-type ribon-helix-helix transcriptional regulator